MTEKKRRNAVYYTYISETEETNIDNVCVGDLVKNKDTDEELGKIDKIMINLGENKDLDKKYIIYTENKISSINDIVKLI